MKTVQSEFFYAGTKTLPPSRGIYGFSLNRATGEITPAGLMAEAKNPAFLAKHPAHDILYTIADSENPQRQDGIVIAFRPDPETHHLHRINSLHTEAPGATHLSVHPDGTHLFTANFHSGTFSVFALHPDGSLKNLLQNTQLHGHGPNPTRQAISHPHWAATDPSGRFLRVCDLGTDRLYSYILNPAKTTYLPNKNQPFATVPSGAGPRHAVYSPDGLHFFVINEITCTLDLFLHDPATGILRHLQSLPTLPAGFFGENKAAGIVLHPNGKFLYVSNRGADLITAVTLDGLEKNKQNSPDAGFSGNFATVTQHIPSGGRFPRFITLDPTGRFLLALNEKSHHLALFRIHPETGKLSPIPCDATVPWGTGGVFA